MNPNTLTFIPSDFVDLSQPILRFRETDPNQSWLEYLDIPSNEQYQNVEDCPFARAYLRQYNSPAWKEHWPDDCPYWEPIQLNAIRQRLLAGEESVTVNL